MVLRRRRPLPKKSTTITAHLTEKSLDKVVRENRPPVGGSDIFVWDREQKGFGLRVYAPREAGQPTRAAFICRHARGRVTLGSVFPYSLRAAKKGEHEQTQAIDDLVLTVERARQEAARYSAAGKKGRDLGAEARQAQREARNAIRLGALVDLYLSAREADMRRRSWEEIERQLRRRDWKPYHGRAANSITRADVIDRVNEIAKDSGRVAADRARTALSGLYRWAINSGGYHSLENPCIGVKSLAKSERHRTLSESELREVWLASDPAVAGTTAGSCVC